MGFLILSLLLLAARVFAAPTDTAIPDRVALAKRATCTPASLGSDQDDDTPAIKAAITSCGNGGTIVIPAGVTYSLRTSLDFAGCAGCDFQLEGTLKASDDIDFWATQTAIISLSSITNVKFRSLTGAGVIDGNGQDAYDAFAVNSSLSRPTAILVDGGSGITVSGLTMKNVPNVFISHEGGVTNVLYSSITMTAASKSTNAPKNTDGYDIGESTFTTIQNAIVTNQDDCVAFKAGCNFVTVDTITCQGTTHGLSVGSLGETNADTVQNIFVTNATMINATKAVGIKLYDGGSTHGTSTVTNVTWDGVTVQDCEYGAQIQSCYNEDPDNCSGTPSAANLTDINFTNFVGTTSGTDTANIDCPPDGTCGLLFTDWNVENPSGEEVNLCANTPSSMGITCTSGATG